MDADTGWAWLGFAVTLIIAAAVVWAVFAVFG